MKKPVRGQLSFDDFCWGHNSKTASVSISHKEPVNEHQIKSYQNAQGAKIFCCSKCGMWFTEDELHTGTYDHHCEGYRMYDPAGRLASEKGKK